LTRAGKLGSAHRLRKRRVQRLPADLVDPSISTGMVAGLRRRAAESVDESLFHRSNSME
jgi:hypothetical protein